jgi:hypothetical protein
MNLEEVPMVKHDEIFNHLVAGLIIAFVSLLGISVHAENKKSPQIVNQQRPNATAHLPIARPQLPNAVPQLPNAVPQLPNAIPQLPNAVPQLPNAGPVRTNTSPDASVRGP